MIRVLVLLAFTLVAPVRADAAMMVHYDLAGLIVQSDAVVVAEIVGGSPDGVSFYRTVRVLRGNAKVGDLVEVDRLYVMPKLVVEPNVVMFIKTTNGKRHLVPSGLRVIAAGKAWRFEQYNNPGPFEAVPQGVDPRDQWRNGGAQLDRAGLERAIADAGKRVDALAAAGRLTDPAKRRAATLALFAPAGARAPGFYVDRLAEDARAMLAKAGDLEGALLVEMRDRSGTMRRSDYATLAELLKIAVDPARPVDVRAQAIGVIGRGFGLLDDVAAMRAMIQLVDDPSPIVRAAAVETAARPANAQMGDKTAQAALDKIVVEARTAMTKRFATEQDARVLAAILYAFEGAFRKPPPTRASGPLAVARVHILAGSLVVDVYCMRPGTITASKVTLAAPNTPPVTAPAFNIGMHGCGQSPGTGAGSSQSLAAGRYEIAVDYRTPTAASTVLPLGTLVVDASGELSVTP